MIFVLLTNNCNTKTRNRGMAIWMGIFLFYACTLSYNGYAIRFLVDTTCLGLAKPSNQLNRLSCSGYAAYHCLPDMNFTNEVEICKKWKWIPGGHCAFINDYGWEIDARKCIEEQYKTCPKSAFISTDNIKYTACYKKTTIPVPSHTTTRIVEGCSDGYFWNYTIKRCHLCMPGYSGINCTQQCYYPAYGLRCKGYCDCKEDLCDKSIGCIPPSTGVEDGCELVRYRIDLCTDVNRGKNKMEDTAANNRESKSSSEDCSPDTSSTAVPQMKRSHSDTGAASSSSSKVKKRCKQVHFAEPSESSSSQANSDSPLLLQNVPSLTSRWTEDVLSRFKIQVTQNSPDMHNMFLQGCLHFVPDTQKCAELMELFMSKEDNVYECYKHVLQNVFSLHCDDISTVNLDDIKEMERALADPGWIKAFTDGFQNKKICRRTLKDISRKLQQFVWQLIYMVRTHHGEEGEKVTEEMYQELFVLFAKTFGLHILSGGNVNQYGLIAGESGRFVAIPDAVIGHPMTEEEQICAVVQVRECHSNNGNPIQRSSSPDHVGGDLQSKHVGQSLCVLPYSVFGERGMFGILVDGTKVTISVFKTDSSYYQKLCNGCLPKNEAAVTFSKQYNILRKDGRTECIQTFLHLKKLLEYLTNKSFP